MPALMAGWDYRPAQFKRGVSSVSWNGQRLPVVASDLPTLHEAVVPGKGGLLVRPGSAPDFAAALLHILKAPEKARAMGEFNRQRVDTYFDEERMVRCTRALYEGLLT